MKVIFNTFLTTLFLCLTLNIHANELDYIKNLGQWNNDVNYKVNIQGGQLFLENQFLTYVFYDTQSLHDTHEYEHDNFKTFNGENHFIDAHAFKVELLGANLGAAKVAYQPRTEYHNYFVGNDSDKWAGKVPLYKGVKYSSIYSGIDLNFYSQELNLKYDFIVAPGANPDQIALQYDGLLNASLKEGALHLNIGFNTIIEQKPFAYQIINNKQVEVQCNYVFQNNTLSFELPDGYNESYELIIDPVLIAATLSGSTVTNYGHSATYDNEGNIYTGARNFGAGYPTTTGAFQISYGGGGTDIAISKLNPDGSSLLWATYIGGNNSEYPHSMFVNGDELYVLGSSSSSDYPTTGDAFDTSNNSTDIVITHLSNDGASLIGSTFVGGTGVDGTNNIYTNYADTYRGEIIVDEEGNAFIASFSSSPDFPTTTNAYQPNLSGGQDGVIFKLNSDLSNMLWATYIGGNLDDAAYGIRLDDNGEVYVTGSAGDNTFPSTSNAYNTNYLGGTNDAYVLQLSSDGSSLLNSTFFGTDEKDQSFFLDIDVDGDIYIYGQNEGELQVSMGCYGNVNSNQFIAKFNSELNTLQWQTVIGSGGSTWGGYEFVPIAFMVDICKHIYISGHGANSGLYVSTNPIISTGGFYEMVLEADATAVNYATYYSGDHVDGGTSRFDPSGKIYQAVCSGGGFSTTADAYAPSQSSGWDIAVFKIDLNTSIVNAQAGVAPSNTGCTPFDVNFINSSSTGNYEWDFGDGTTSTSENPNHTYTTSGAFNVELVVTDPESCNFSDTTYIPMFVSSSNGEYSFSIDNACLGTPIQFSAIGATSLDTILWDLGDGTITTNLNPLHDYASTGVYDINLTINSICNLTASFEDQIEVDSVPSLELGEDLNICQDESVLIQAISNAENYLWQDNSTNSFIYANTEGLYTIQAFNGDCSVSDDLLVIQDPFIFTLDNDTTLCYNDSLLILDAGPEPTSFLWSTGDTTQTIEVSEGNYSVTVTSDFGCEYLDDITIYVQNFDLQIQASSTEECVPATIEFEDISTVTHGEVNSWQWDFSPGLSSSSSPSTTYDNTGLFDVELTITTPENCSQTFVFEDYIQINPNPLADFSYSTFIENGCQVLVEFTNESSGEQYYNWVFNNGTEQNIANPSEYFEYNSQYTATLEVENEFTCKDSTEQVFTIPKFKPVYVPNVFTPNGDQVNDIFKPVSECIEEIEFYIYDRWGELMFFSEHIDHGWNGTHENELMQNNSYTWYLKYSHDGELIEENGFVILLQ